jgi:hypothetical protein
MPGRAASMASLRRSFSICGGKSFSERVAALRSMTTLSGGPGSEEEAAAAAARLSAHSRRDHPTGDDAEDYDREAGAAEEDGKAKDEAGDEAEEGASLLDPALDSLDPRRLAQREVAERLRRSFSVRGGPSRSEWPASPAHSFASLRWRR